MARKETYLDWNATAPLRPEAAAAMAAALAHCGNPSSVHRWGRMARSAVERGRAAVAALVGAVSEGVIFVSGGTEANHLALLGAGRQRILVSAVEHDSVLRTIPEAEEIPVDRDGIVRLDALERMLGADSRPALVSVMLANNETGVIQPVAEVAKLAHALGALFHCDAVQAAGKIPLDVAAIGADLVTLSAHKLGGPPGVGALAVNGGIELAPLLRGGGQERGRRAGTENLAGIAGFAAAAATAAAEIAVYDRVRRLRDWLEAEVEAAAPEAVVVGAANISAAQHGGDRDAGFGGGNAGHGARSRRRHGQRRCGLLVGQGRAEPCAGGDASSARDCSLDDPGQPRLEHERGRCGPLPAILDRALPPPARRRRGGARGMNPRQGHPNPGYPLSSQAPPHDGANKLPIYLDNQSSTRVDPRVLEAMLPYFTEDFGNPHSTSHAYGRSAAAAVEHARAELAALIGADPREIVFTSGATEANNLAVKGAARFARAHPQGDAPRDRIVTVTTEHKCVLESCAQLEREGFEIAHLPVEPNGLVDLDQVAAALTPRTLLVSVMAAHNEIGVIQPLAEIGALCHEKGVLFHSDAAQAVGKIPLDVEAMQIDLLSISGHKVYGPKGVGALYIRRRRPRVRLSPLIDGGGQERGLRSGTLPTPLCVGLGRAAAIAAGEMTQEAGRLRQLRDRLHQGLARRVAGLRLNGDAERRLAGNLNLSFPGIEAPALIEACPSIAISTGSACTSATIEPSYVLRALGLDDAVANSAIRIGLGRFNTAAEVDFAVDALAAAAHRLAAGSEIERQPGAIPT